MSNLLVQNIKHTNNTTAMTIDTSGQVTIRGEACSATLLQTYSRGWLKVWFNQIDGWNIYPR